TTVTGTANTAMCLNISSSLLRSAFLKELRSGNPQLSVCPATQSSYEEGHMHSFAWRLTPSSVISFVSLSASITSAIDVQLLFQRESSGGVQPCVVVPVD